MFILPYAFLHFSLLNLLNRKKNSTSSAWSPAPLPKARLFVIQPSASSPNFRQTPLQPKSLAIGNIVFIPFHFFLLLFSSFLPSFLFGTVVRYTVVREFTKYKTPLKSLAIGFFMSFLYIVLFFFLHYNILYSILFLIISESLSFFNSIYFISYIHDLFSYLLSCNFSTSSHLVSQLIDSMSGHCMLDMLSAYVLSFSFVFCKQFSK